MGTQIKFLTSLVTSCGWGGNLRFRVVGFCSVYSCSVVAQHPEISEQIVSMASQLPSLHATVDTSCVAMAGPDAHQRHTVHTARGWRLRHASSGHSQIQKL